MKTLQSSPWLFLLLLLEVGTAGCGTTGGTSTFVLRPPSGARPLAKQLSVAAVIMEEEAPALIAVAVFEWGKLDTNDVAHIAQSLRDTVRLLPSSPAEPPRPQLEIHVVVRKYVVALSNTSGAVLARVAWAVTEEGGELIHQEEFYCAKKVYLVGTIGLLKDSVHKAVVQRIAERSALLASQKPATVVGEVRVKSTYDSIEEAAAHLPKRMVSMGNPGLAGLGGVVGLVGLAAPRAASEVGWESFMPPAEFDWKNYLGQPTTP
jgi:hypothetical protein